MTDEERAQRQAEIYAARDHYERLIEAYERDMGWRNTKFPIMTLDDMLRPSRHEEQQSEEEYRRGYGDGVSQAIDHFWGMVKEKHVAFADAYNALFDWRTGALGEWFDAAKHGDFNSTPPPNPVTPKREK